MIRTILAATLIAGATFTSAFAAEGPRLVGTGDNAQIVIDTPRSIVGGGIAQLTGTGNDAVLSYGAVSGGQASQAGAAELAQVGLSSGKGA